MVFWYCDSFCNCQVSTFGVVVQCAKCTLGVLWWVGYVWLVTPEKVTPIFSLILIFQSKVLINKFMIFMLQKPSLLHLLHMMLLHHLLTSITSQDHLRLMLFLLVHHLILTTRLTRSILLTTSTLQTTTRSTRTKRWNWSEII